MIRKFTLFSLACMVMFSAAVAQHCGFDQKHQQLMNSNPAYATQVAQGDAWWANYQMLMNNALPVTLSNGKFAHELPVVVHVMYTNEKAAYNVSTTKIQNLINYLNESFQATYSSYPDTQSGGTRIPIVFKLAARDPNCMATNGINYVDMSSNSTYYQYGMAHNTANGVAEGTVKALSRWPRDQYINIWIISKMDGADGLSPGPFTAGFAYLPPGPSTLDGIVMLASVTDVGDITLPHEMGHYFGLYHVFQGGTTTVCPTNTNCNTQGDRVCDTEPQRQSQFNCPSAGTPTPTNPCTGVAYTNGPNNFMDYSNCQNRFTPGQRARMISLMQLFRSRLLSSLGAVPPPATPLPTACIPTMPAPPTTSSYGPRDIQISTDNFATNVLDVLSSGYTGDGSLHYIDNTCTDRAELLAGVPHKIRVNFFTGFPLTSRLRVYIDYNNDGDFQDANETITTATGVVSTPQTIDFTPPLTGAVYCIPLRMRVVADSAIAIGECTVHKAGQTEDYEVIIRGAANNNLTGLVNVFVNPEDGNPSCAGVMARVESTINSSITPVWYKWFKTRNGVLTQGPSSSNPSDSTWGATNWVTGDSVYLKVAYSGLCGIDTAISDTVIMNRPLTIPPSLSIKVANGSNPTCVDEVVTLGIDVAVNNGGASYQWYRNGNPISGATNNTYNVSGGTSGDVYHLVMTLTPTLCNGFSTTVVSTNTITITHTTKAPVASIALTIGTNPGCAGQLLTFTASGTTLGVNPTYQWRINTIPVSGATASSFTSTFNNLDNVDVVITSSSQCAVPSTATSNTITILQQFVTADVTISQVSGGNPACSGHPVVFVANPVNAGANPQFQWLVNSSPVAGANLPVFNTSSLANNDVVSCILISTDPCVLNTLDTSAPIQMVITPSAVPKVSIALTAGNNPGCLDSLVEFTATATDAGTNPDFEWLVNGFPLSLNNAVYSSTNLLNNDVVVARVVPTDGQCYLPDTGFSAPVTMVRSPTPDPPIISLIHNMLVTNKSGSFVWFGPNGQLTGGDDGKLHPGELGKYYAVTNNNGCWSKPSNILTITLLDINDVSLPQANIYPNPTTGKLTIDWSRNVNMTVSLYSTVGQKLMEEKVVNASNKVLNLGDMASGMYFVVITDEDGRSSTTRVTLTK